MHTGPQKDQEVASGASDSASQGDDCSESEDEGTEGYKKGAATCCACVQQLSIALLL